jgi:hypothetical protein
MRVEEGLDFDTVKVFFLCPPKLVDEEEALFFGNACSECSGIASFPGAGICFWASWGKEEFGENGNPASFLPGVMGLNPRVAEVVSIPPNPILTIFATLTTFLGWSADISFKISLRGTIVVGVSPTAIASGVEGGGGDGVVAGVMIPPQFGHSI